MTTEEISNLYIRIVFQYESALEQLVDKGLVDKDFNENSFTFEGKVLNSHVREIADYITAKVDEYKKQKSGQAGAVSSADELKKFKDLLDSGVITQEEFDAKKKQLLGL